MDDTDLRKRAGELDPSSPLARRQAAADEHEEITPPFNIEAEQALLGAILMNNEAYTRVSGWLRPEHFYEPVHGRIYEVATTLINRSEVADVISCKSYFEHDGALAEIGGVKYLAHLAAAATSLMSVEHYGRMVVDLAKRRSIIDIARDMIDRARQAGIDDGAVRQAQDALHQLDDLADDDRTDPMSWGDALTLAVGDMDIAYKGGTGLAGLPYGFRVIDDLTGGIVDSELIVLAGDTSEGKSALLIDIMVRTARAGHPCLLFSMEMREQETALRGLSAKLGIPYSDLRKGQFGADDWPVIVTTARGQQKLPLWIDTEAETPDQMADVVRRHKKRHGVRLVGCDYLQLMQADGRVNGDTERFNQITRGLKKRVAVAQDVPVIALSQYTQEPAKALRRPRLTDIYGGHAIRQHANTVLLMYREELRVLARLAELEVGDADYGPLNGKLAGLKDKLEIAVGKCRSGRTGKTMIDINLAVNTFTDEPEPENDRQGSFDDALA